MTTITLYQCHRAGLFRLALFFMLIPIALGAPRLYAQGTDGTFPTAPVIEANDGMLYGTTTAGGKFGKGCVFTIAPDGSAYRVVRSFGSSSTDATGLQYGVIQASDGMLYGAASSGGPSPGYGTLFVLSTDGLQYRVFHHFGGPDGEHPSGPLMEAKDGYLYGECYSGGEGSNGDVGNVFQVSRDGSVFKTVHNFQNGSDGANPQFGLIQGIDDNLYGVTNGAYTRNTPGNAVMFKVATNGTGYEPIYHYFSNDANYLIPNELVQSSIGTIYGTDNYGTQSSSDLYESNAEFGYYELIYFDDSAFGAHPIGPLVIAADGEFFGTCNSGGTFGNGAVFKADDGGGYTLIRSFGTSYNDAANPAATVCIGSDGVTLFGTTQNGGKFAAGTVFKVKMDGTGYQVLHSFGN